MKIVEIFRSIQGEGKTQGRNSLFIRFFGCNCDCLVCDSKYTWNKNNVEDIGDEKVYNEVEKNDNIVFTGGEPLLRDNLIECLKIMFKYPDKTYEFETNGTIELSAEELQYLNKCDYIMNISPKENVTQLSNIETQPKLLTQLNVIKDYIVKPIVKTDEDFCYIENLQDEYNIPSHKIYIQPEGIEFDSIKNIIINNWNEIINRGWNISSRLHVALFGNKRGI